MDIFALVMVFLTSVVVAGCAVFAFSASMDGVLKGLISGELAAAWSKYAKFALMVMSFSGGLRLQEIQALAASGRGAQPLLSAGQCLLEIYKTIAGALLGASWTLLAFFGAALAAHLGIRVYDYLKSTRHDRVAHNSGAPTTRF